MKLHRQSIVSLLYRILLILLMLSIVIACAQTSDPRAQFADDQQGLVTPSTRCTPVYPRHAAIARIQGWVEVEYSIDSDGRAYDFTIIAAEPSGVFEQAALHSLKCWKFDPSVGDSQTRHRQTIDFRLED